MNRFPNYFADAEAGFKESDYVIFGVPYDKTSSFRYGARKAPFEIRQASWNFESFHIDTKTDLTKIKVHDYGDIDVSDMESSEMVRVVEDFTMKIVKENKIPIAIGGEHSITSGIISALSKNYSNLNVVFLDAHLDFRDSYEGNKFNHACSLRRVADVVGIENVANLGIRSAEKEEYESALEKKLYFVESQTIRSKGVSAVINEIKKRLSNNLYLSLDFDVIDPSFAPAVSTPEPFGLTPYEVLELIRHLASRIVGFDIVEVCPPYDNGETSLLAAKIIRLAVDEFWRSKRLS
ncbi:MAG: agmatinase [Thermoplasmata archaeon]|nr:agmatinase [Thermoplasmata archaeon]